MHGSLSLRPALALGASLADQAYQLIKDDLFSFRLLPGERFTETDLAARLGVSRTPVRLGLARLEREGFVLASPRSGWQARPFDFERFEALYDLRIVLELAAVERLCARERADGRICWRPCATSGTRRRSGACWMAGGWPSWTRLSTARWSRRRAIRKWLRCIVT